MTTIKVEELDQRIFLTHDGQYVGHYKNMVLKSVFQPIYHYDMSIIGLEALVRIHHQNGSMIRPDDFFHSDDTPHHDKINVERLSRLVHIRNFSLSHYRDKKLFLNVLPNAVERLALEVLSCRVLLKTLAQFGISPKQVVMELIEIDANCEAQLQQSTRVLGRNGFQWAIDDFGVNASTQERTERILPHIIKLDRSLLYQFEQGEPDKLLDAIQLARNIGSQIVVEGIETQNQLALMRQLKIDMYQGYHLAMPAPVYTQPIAKLSYG
ncbi:EAL domain-containing protein [Vibrio sp. SM6]|uniref:EAL domain-containing protein n=1 Tax=Vibrio agarilyticus TaxID=2726741 RepID=A0A7X8TRD6_9VIBR|nr:EAL domain-containing protein [Vibrio agarilyticus]NLS13431.1 EAL domain-containing protein [Vibrio agarilyticus]